MNTDQSQKQQQSRRHRQLAAEHRAEAHRQLTAAVAEDVAAAELETDLAQERPLVPVGTEKDLANT